MTAPRFETQLRRALRSGAYVSLQRLALVRLAILAERQAETDLGPVLTEILAFAVSIDTGGPNGPDGEALLASAKRIAGKMDPFTNPVFVRFGSAVSVDQAVEHAHAVADART